MNEVVRIALAKIIVRHARPPALDVRRCEGLLRDYLRGEYKREINVLVSALREQVVSDLLGSGGTMPAAVLLTRCTRKLQDRTGIAEDLARWSVESWALALGVIAPDTVTGVGKTTTTAPVSPQAWYYKPENQIINGPVSSAELKKLADTGQLSPDNRVWTKGLAEWKHARSIKGLFPAAAPCPPVAPIPSSIESLKANDSSRGQPIEKNDFTNATGITSANVIELTAASWEKEVVQRDKPVLVHFWAVWCSACRTLAPTVEKIADQFAGKVKVGKLNTDEHQEIAIKYGISAIPQLLLFKGGDQPIDKQIGNQPMDSIVKMLNRALESLSFPEERRKRHVETTKPSEKSGLKQVEDVRDPYMARQATVQSASDGYSLRPRWLRDVIGQKAIVQRLNTVLNSSKKLNEPVPHILFDGPPGIGKTTLATVLPNELGTSIQMTSGPALRGPADLLPFLTNVEGGSILFINEIHRMPRAVEEFIYPAMEDFRIDIVLGEGMNRRTINLRLKPFTVIGATTRSGMLSGPMRDRFKMHEHLEYYTVAELAEIIRINARKLATPITEDAALELGQRSRGTPRVANARLWWSRHYASSEADGQITLEVARTALDMAEVDRDGLDKQDRRYLELLVGIHNGGPAGVESLAASMTLPVDTLSDEIEPYLLREQFIVRTPRGRMATARAYQVLGRPMKPAAPEERQPGLFD